MRNRPFAELTALAKCIDVLRWLCVLPAAVLGDLTVVFLMAGAFRLVRELALAVPDDSPAASFALGIPGGSIITTVLTLLLFYLIPKMTFTVVGGVMAPRYQASTAMLLTLLGIIRSTWTHGLTNWLHVSAETAGLMAGAAYIVWQNRRDRSKRAGALPGEGPAMPGQ